MVQYGTFRHSSFVAGYHFNNLGWGRDKATRIEGVEQKKTCSSGCFIPTFEQVIAGEVQGKSR
jgi:hypothetical protein